MSLVEDALKTTRTLHRLVIGVSVAGIVFALSLHPPDELSEMLSAIDRVERFDLRRYEDWVDQKAHAAFEKRACSSARDLERFFDEHELTWSGRERVVDWLTRPLHTGYVWMDRVTPEQTLGEIETFLDRSGGIPAQVTVLDCEAQAALLEQIVSEGDTYPSEGVHVRNVQVFFDPQFGERTTRFEEHQVAGALSLELSVPSQYSAPIVQLPFVALAEDVPSTDINSFLETQRDRSSFPFVRAGEHFSLVEALPMRRDDLEEMTINQAQARLQEEIAAASPDQRDLPLLTVRVPGRLAVVAAPLLAAILLVYLWANIRHLQRLPSDEFAGIGQFAWLPISASVRRGWYVEPALTLGVLPVITAALLLWKVASFGSVSVVTGLVTVVAGIAAVLLASLAIVSLARLRARVACELASSRKSIWAT